MVPRKIHLSTYQDHYILPEVSLTTTAEAVLSCTTSCGSLAFSTFGWSETSKAETKEVPCFKVFYLVDHVTI